MASRWFKVILAASALAFTPVAAAQQDLAIRAGEAWTHGHSGITVPPTLGGNALTKAKAYASEELDVSLAFEASDAGEMLTFYVFRNTNGGVPVWFAQAQWGIEHRGIYGNPALAIGPQAFAPPGQASASGLKAVYEARGDAGYRSTGIVLLPVGEWYVKLRASSKSRSAPELEAWMDTALTEIGWPQEIATATAATPVTDCARPLNYAKKTKNAPVSLGSLLVNSTLLSARAQKDESGKAKTPKPVQWCRDTALGDNRAAYRANGAKDAYLLAVGDNGVGIGIGPDAGAALLMQGSRTYSITLHAADQDVVFAAQDRLPSPQRVLDVVGTGRRSAAVSTWGEEKKIELNSDAM